VGGRTGVANTTNSFLLRSRCRQQTRSLFIRVTRPRCAEHARRRSWASSFLFWSGRSRRLRPWPRSTGSTSLAISSLMSPALIESSLSLFAATAGPLPAATMTRGLHRVGRRSPLDLRVSLCRTRNWAGIGFMGSKSPLPAYKDSTTLPLLKQHAPARINFSWGRRTPCLLL
jgi:hypothetical protein